MLSERKRFLVQIPVIAFVIEMLFYGLLLTARAKHYRHVTVSELIR